VFKLLFSRVLRIQKAGSVEKIGNFTAQQLVGSFGAIFGRKKAVGHPKERS
jgi:hypothetical protein